MEKTKYILCAYYIGIGKTLATEKSLICREIIVFFGNAKWNKIKVIAWRVQDFFICKQEDVNMHCEFVRAFTSTFAQINPIEVHRDYSQIPYCKNEANK